MLHQGPDRTKCFKDRSFIRQHARCGLIDVSRFVFCFFVHVFVSNWVEQDLVAGARLRWLRLRANGVDQTRIMQPLNQGC